jgi:regulator of replication initiation timing
MKNVYIDSSESRWLDEYFKKGMVTIDEILDKCEDLIIENKELQEELDDLKQDLHDNYIPKPQED